MRIVFLGTGEIGVPALRALAACSEHVVCAVFTQPDRPAGRDLKLRPSPVKLAAADLALPVFQPEKIRAPEALAQLAALAPEILVVAAYGQILPRSVLGLPPRGCLNIHASLLPCHRGASPINATILAGDTKTGITIMQMDAGLDTGDILHQEAIPIGPEETAGQLHDRLAEVAPGALLKTLDRAARGVLAPQKQEETLATYAPKLMRADGEIDWRRTAAEIDRQIRGLTPWPGAFTCLPGQPPVLLKIHRAVPRADRSGPPGTVLQAAGELIVAAGQGAMALQEIQLAGGRRVAAAEFLRGHALSEGTKLGTCS